jgi:hypothetical protein
MLTALWQAAQAGPVLEAELLPLSNQGRLRVTYNWLYSALNCTPDDASPFVWVLRKIDAQHCSLSPKDGYQGRTLYASVRDDLGYRVQVQAPYSADWITAVGRDEVLSFAPADLFMQFFGFNGQPLTVAASPITHDGHTGCQVVSTGPAALSRANTWLVRPLTLLQPGLLLPPPPTLLELQQATQRLGQPLLPQELASLLG